MHSLVAISPTILDNWADLRYLADKLGYDKGVLLVNIPKRWMGMVYDAGLLKNISEIDRKRVELKLIEIKSKSIKIGYKSSFKYDSELDWIDNLKSPILDSVLDAIITTSTYQNNKLYDFYNEKDDGALDGFFGGATSKYIPQTAEAIGGAAEYLLNGESIINIIDPYFAPKKKNIKVLTALSEISKKQNNSPKTYVIHCSYDMFEKTSSTLNNAEVEGKYRSLLQSLLSEKSKVEVYFWRYLNVGGSDIHPRYLITNKGGLNFDRGFVEPENLDARSRPTIVKTISKKLCGEVLDIHNESNNELICMEKVFV